MNPASGNYRHSPEIWIIDTAGAMHQVGSYFATASYVYNTPDGSMWFGNTPFGPQGRIVPLADGWIHSEGERFEYAERRLDNTLTRIVRVQRPRRPVTAIDRGWFMDSLLADYEPKYRDGERAAAEWAEWALTMPAYDALVHDSEGMIWARVYPYDAAMATWDIFDPEGRLVAMTTTPARLDVKQIGPDWILGQAKGEMDEPLVMLFTLRR